MRRFLLQKLSGKKQPMQNLTAYGVSLLQGKAYRHINAKITTVLTPYELSIPEWKIVGLLHENKQLKLNEIAEILDVEAPQVTKLIELLEQKKLITKEENPEDRRAKLASITPKGKKIVPQIEKKIKSSLTAIFKGVPQADINAYLKVLSIIVNRT